MIMKLTPTNRGAPKFSKQNHDDGPSLLERMVAMEQNERLIAALNDRAPKPVKRRARKPKGVSEALFRNVQDAFDRYFVKHGARPVRPTHLADWSDTNQPRVAPATVKRCWNFLDKG